MNTNHTATIGQGTAIHYGKAGDTMTECGKRGRTGTNTRLRDANGAAVTCKTCLKMDDTRNAEVAEVAEVAETPAPVAETPAEVAPVAAYTVKIYIMAPATLHRVERAETHHNRLSDAYAAFWNFVQNQSDDGRDSLRTDGELNRRIGGDTFTGYWTVELIQN